MYFFVNLKCVYIIYWLWYLFFSVVLQVHDHHGHGKEVVPRPLAPGSPTINWTVGEERLHQLIFFQTNEFIDIQKNQMAIEIKKSGTVRPSPAAKPWAQKVSNER